MKYFGGKFKQDITTKIKYIFMILVLLIISICIGFYLGNKNSIVNIDNSSKINSSDIDIPAVRNTAVVEAVKKIGPSVVGITSRAYGKDIFNRKVFFDQSVGSGVIFDKKGYIVTNNHVVIGSEDVIVSLTDGKTVSGKVIGRDSATDLAVIKIEPIEKLPVASFGDSDKLQSGETVIAIGNPLGLEFKGTVTVGVVSALNRTLDKLDQRIKLIQTDAAINPGNSGGALVTSDGNVVGINSSKIVKHGVEGIGFAIPINQVKLIAKQLIENGRVIRAYLGIYMADKDFAEKHGYSWEHDGGILVLDIALNSPLINSGINRGDYLMKIDDISVNNVYQIKDLLDKHSPGDKINILYESDGRLNKTTVKLSEAFDA